MTDPFPGTINLFLRSTQSMEINTIKEKEEPIYYNFIFNPKENPNELG